MSTLKERLEIVMTEMTWQHADLVRVSGQSSSVVSQWLGKGSKEIKTIGKMEAALNIERASGFAALWVAKGQGPMRVTDGLKFSVADDDPEAPPRPPEDFSDRHVVTESEWGLLQEMKDAMETPALAAKLQDLREEVAALRGFAEKHLQRRIAASRGGHVGGMSAFGDLDGPTVIEQPDAQKKRKS